MGTREKLFRQKLAAQLETLLTHSEKVFSAEKLDKEWVSSMIKETQELTSVLTIYQFIHELPEDTDLHVEFLELQEQEKQAKEPLSTPNYGDEILKEIDEFETTIAEDIPVEEEEIQVEATSEEKKEIKEESQAIQEVVDETPIVEPTVPEGPVISDEETIEVKEDVIEIPIEKEPVVVATEEALDNAIEINDVVANVETSLADKLRNKSIKKLAESIALNERFLYSNELFNGNMEAFKRALNELDHIASKEDAQRYINLQLKVENNWNEESNTTQAFITLVERRFN